MAYNDVIPILVFISSQVTPSGGLIACTHHFYSYGKKRLKTIYCDDWEHCCSSSCCQTPLDIYRLWYFWIGIFLLTVVCITIWFTWYKKKTQGRVIRVGPLSSNQMSIETVDPFAVWTIFHSKQWSHNWFIKDRVITQYTIQPHLYAATYTSIPAPTLATVSQPLPAGPPPPYQQMSTYPELPQYTPFAPVKPR